MGGNAHSFGLIRRVVWPALALIIVGNFAGYAVAGPNGLLAWGGYHRDLQARKIELAQLEAEKAQLRHRSALLDPRKADPDLADEMVRQRPRPGPARRGHRPARLVTGAYSTLPRSRGSGSGCRRLSNAVTTPVSSRFRQKLQTVDTARRLDGSAYR